jgi:hypothetical protein
VGAYSRIMKPFLTLLILALHLVVSATFTIVEGAALSREELCKGIQNNYECAKRIEAVLVPLQKGKVRRIGAELIFTLKDGHTASRKDTPGEFESFNDSSGNPNRSFTFSEYIEKQGYYLVQVHYYEGTGFELINAATGVSVEIFDRPVFSPDGQRFFVVSTDDYDPITNEMQVWTIKPSRVQKEWAYKPKHWPWVIAKWIDSSKIDVFYREWSKERGEYPAKLVARVKKNQKDNGWTVSEKD